MQFRIAGPAPLTHALLLIHASGAWSYGGSDGGDDDSPVVLALE